MAFDEAHLLMGKPLEYWRELERTAKKMNIANLVLENINHKAEIKRLKGKMHDAARSLWDHDRERDRGDDDF